MHHSEGHAIHQVRQLVPVVLATWVLSIPAVLPLFLCLARMASSRIIPLTVTRLNAGMVVLAPIVLVAVILTSVLSIPVSPGLFRVIHFINCAVEYCPSRPGKRVRNINPRRASGRANSFEDLSMTPTAQHLFNRLVPNWGSMSQQERSDLTKSSC
jgi:hypothetical protein